MPELTEREQAVLTVQRAFDRNETLERENKMLANALKKARQDHVEALITEGDTPTANYSQGLLMILAKEVITDEYIDLYQLFETSYISDDARKASWENQDFEAFFKTLGSSSLTSRATSNQRVRDIFAKMPINDLLLFIKDNLKVRWDKRLAHLAQIAQKKAEEEAKKAAAEAEKAEESSSGEDE